MRQEDRGFGGEEGPGTEGAGGRLARRVEIRPVPFALRSPKVPPVIVVEGRGGTPTKDPPTPLVHQVAKGQEGDLFQCHL